MPVEMYNPPTQKQKDELMALSSQGATLAEMSAATGIRETVLLGVLKDLGVRPEPDDAAPAKLLRNAEIRRLYIDGVRGADIAREYMLTRQRVMQIVMGKNKAFREDVMKAVKERVEKEEAELKRAIVSMYEKGSSIAEIQRGLGCDHGLVCRVVRSSACYQEKAEIKSHVMRLYKAGLKYKEISKLTELSYIKVKSIIEHSIKAGRLEPRRTREGVRKRDEVLIEEFKAGMSRQALADKYGLQLPAINAIISKRGASNKAKNKEYTPRPEYFEIMKMSKDGIPQVQIAQKFETTQANVSRILKVMKDKGYWEGEG